ncbi:arsenic metallochaperone ArsD family protein [Eubacteriaceae bacterium ES3]|nr:arsenic metallochaperone ArsD family protein [Eubacteriaceae bacterium ES3]
MKTVEIYDTQKLSDAVGCGSSADREKFRLATIIKALSRDGKNIKQYGLDLNPESFTENKAVQEVMQTGGQAALPIILVDGELQQTGIYPSNLEMANWFGISKDELVLILMKEKMASKSFCGGDCC